MDVRQLSYFLAVVDQGGYSQAAVVLYVSQPALSQAINALERDLGTPLFHRIGRRAVLTDAGTALIGPARTAVHSLELARATVESVQGLQSGRVDIASMPSPAIEPLTTMFQRFTAKYPQVSMLVRAAFTPVDVVDMVRTGESELGLLVSPNEVSNPAVEQQLVMRQRFVLISPPGGPFPEGTVVQATELAGQRLIVVQEGTSMRWYVNNLRSQGIELTFTVETEHRVGILPMVLSGAGLALLNDSWTSYARRMGAVVLDIEPNADLRTVLVRRRGELTPAARAFFDLTAEAYPTDT